MIKDIVEQAILDFFTGVRSVGEVLEIASTKEKPLSYDDTANTLYQASREWGATEIDREGATQEQDKQLDTIIESTARELMS